MTNGEKIARKLGYMKNKRKSERRVGDGSFLSNRREGTICNAHLVSTRQRKVDQKTQHEHLRVLDGHIRTKKRKTYRLRISNTRGALSFNFRIQNHQMILVETEGSYTNQIAIDSMDVHVGQSYSVLVHAYQPISDYYIVASPTQVDIGNIGTLNGVAVLHYKTSSTPPNGLLPMGPEPLNQDFSVNQAKSIRWNMTTGAARPNPQGSFNIANVTISQTFIFHSSDVLNGNYHRFTVNNVSYLTPKTPLKLADYLKNGAGVYELDAFPVNSTNTKMVQGTFVASGIHKGWDEIIFVNEHSVMNSWHLDGYGFYVVGFGNGEWSPTSRETYNLFDPVVRSTVQVYPQGWSAVYVYLDNPGMWNLRSQILENWYLGQELYIRVHDSDPNPAKERHPPANLLQCGIFDALAPAPAPAPEAVH
ncbi:Monocopper oxidase-like protein SKU5 [Platanthera zijinensis]|uniref:Monocopper oxidase-like protein SKU5 n=1 Tax=Platanthera zijinensis TaxID=2320716 RepID=A0AAP0BWA4_9ASPA